MHRDKEITRNRSESPFDEDRAAAKAYAVARLDQEQELKIAVNLPQIAFSSVAVMCLGLTSCSTNNDTAGANPPAGPTDGLVVDPLTLAFHGVGAAHSQSVTIYNGSTGGTVSESDDCNALSARVAVGNPTLSSTGPVYSITPEEAGTCTLTFKNAAGASGTVAITISI